MFFKPVIPAFARSVGVLTSSSESMRHGRRRQTGSFHFAGAVFVAVLLTCGSLTAAGGESGSVRVEEPRAQGGSVEFHYRLPAGDARAGAGAGLQRRWPGHAAGGGIVGEVCGCTPPGAGGAVLPDKPGGTGKT